MNLWRLLPAALGIVVPTMMQVGPDDAVLNLCKWPRKIAPTLPENCLPGVSSDQLYLLATLSVSVGLLWFGWPYLRDVNRRARMIVGILILCCGVGIAVLGLSIIADGEYRSSPSPATGSTSFPVAWNFEGFLGSNWNEQDGVTVSKFWASGTSLKVAKIEDAYIVSGVTQKRLTASIRVTNGGYVLPRQSNPIPAGADVHMQVLFYDPSVNRIQGEREGLSEWEFLSEWAHFSFVVKIDGVETIHRFESDGVRAQINRVKPPPPKPTATAIERPTGTTPTPRFRSLATLFELDFPATTKAIFDTNVDFTSRDGKKQLSNIPMRSAVYVDLATQSEFVGYYIPDSPVTVDLIEYAASTVERTLKEAHSRAPALYRDMTKPKTFDMSDFKFSGRVYIYHEGELNPAQTGSIWDAYKRRGLNVQFRGPHYAWEQWSKPGK